MVSGMHLNLTGHRAAVKCVEEGNTGISIDKEIRGMKLKKVKISEVKINPNNPRLIKDDKFKKLVKSIEEFPQMLVLSY
jgi:hypothetical protein